MKIRGGGCNPKNRKNPKKTVPNLKFAVAFGFFGFFRFFSVFWYFLVFFGFFSVFVVLFRVFFRFFFGLNFDKKFQPFKNYVSNEVLLGQELSNNTLNAYKALQRSHTSYYDQQEPLNKNPLNQSKFAKMEKKKNKKTEKKNRKNQKKPKKNPKKNRKNQSQI